MENVRQRAFLKLRPPCVELSAVALKFRGKQTSIKSLLHALQDLYSALEELGQEDALDAKLAEYAFFPLSHIFNDSQRLSSRCLEVAVKSLQILVARGWRQNLLPEMGKQLLILMTLLAGGSPGDTQSDPPSDDLKVASFHCIDLLVDWMCKSAGAKPVFDDDRTKTVVDQITYLLLEAITDSPSDLVQLAAVEALSRLTGSIHSRLLLASLLPRTVSALTKTLRPSTQARRTHKVLALELGVLRENLRRVLSDSLAYGDEKAILSPRQNPSGALGDSDILDGSWVKATSSQVKIALTSIVKLRIHDKPDVREALLQLCLMVVEECPKSLSESIPTMVDTMVVLANDSHSISAKSALKHLASSDASIADNLRSSLYTWLMSLPRLMQGSDERPKEQALVRISMSFEILAETTNGTDMLTNSMASTLVDSVSTAVQIGKLQPAAWVTETQSGSTQLLSIQGTPIRTDKLRPVASNTETQSTSMQLLSLQGSDNISFPSIILNHKSQEGSLTALQDLTKNLTALDPSNNVARAIIDRIPNGDMPTQLSSIWLALSMLHRQKTDFMIEDLIEDSALSTTLRNTQPYLISDLYSFALPLLLNDIESTNDAETDWRLRALALECLVLQATQLGTSYRPELIDSLYPVLSLLGSRNHDLQAHAMTALNLLATACDYSSTKDLLVENVDYLVNSIAIKLNSFDLSPQAPQVLLMMVRLCGASLVPYLDDLIGSMFAALDNFHGYPQLVELLFEVLKAIVDESADKPHLAVTDGKTPQHRKTAQRPPTVDDILGDLVEAKSRKVKSEAGEQDTTPSAPRRPWSSTLDGPAEKRALEGLDEPLAEDDEEAPLPPASTDTDQEKAISNSHKLLLSISQATTPHLSSPSPRVRLTLLQLLDRIAPLLAQDENSFLPLINDVWPALVARLFSEVGADGEGEAAYNVCAAAETISKLCEGAGDFMAGRIDDIFPQLEKLYKQVWGRVTTDKGRKGRRKMAQQGNYSGTVELRLVQGPAGLVGNDKPLAFASPSAQTADAQISNALAGLLATILLHVRITDDTGDAMLALLAPLLDEPGKEDVLEALETWNADAVWLVRERNKMALEILGGTRAAQDWEWRAVERPTMDDSLAHPYGTCREVIF